MTNNVVLSSQTLHFDSANSWKRLGLITLATDLTAERDFARIMPHEQVTIYANRVEFQNPTTVESLRDMAPRLTHAASLILPEEPLSAICYSCTSASVVIGDDTVTEAIQKVKPGVPVVTPAQAARMAFAALNVSRIAVLTPYLVDTSKPMAEYFTQHGLAIEKFECFGLEDDRQMALVSCSDIVEATCRLDNPNIEALFISCTALPAVNAIADIEKANGKTGSHL